MASTLSTPITDQETNVPYTPEPCLRSTCPECGREVALTADGDFRVHRSGLDSSLLCDGDDPTEVGHEADAA